jgi:hypothetical protein
MKKALTVRFRVDFGNDHSIGVGKIELLDGIASTGEDASRSIVTRSRDRGENRRDTQPIVAWRRTGKGPQRVHNVGRAA